MRRRIVPTAALAAAGVVVAAVGLGAVPVGAASHDDRGGMARMHADMVSQSPEMARTHAEMVSGRHGD
ncbi:MAG: hypothetical protein ACRDIW_02115 [Actinomycetota bacterium]